MNTRKLIRLRHGSQWAFLALVVLFPLSGLLWFDAANGRFFVADHQVWMEDVWVVLGAVGLLWFLASAFFYPLGQSFCGWLCPQHTVSEFLDGMLRRLLGRRVDTGFAPERVTGHAKVRRFALAGAWAAFGATTLVFALGATVTTLHYFMPTAGLLDQFGDLGRDKLFLGFLVVLFWFFALDFGFVRHFWCRYMCAYGLYQYLFRGRDTLRIRFQEARAADCGRCTLCKDVCPMDLDPRQPEIYTRCINCAICIDACESYLGRFGKDGLLSFGFGNAQGELIRIQGGGSPVRSPRVFWPLAGAVLSGLLLVYGVATFSPIRLSVHQERVVYGVDGGINFKVAVTNKAGVPITLRVAVEGLPAANVALHRPEVTVGVGEAAAVPFRVEHAGLANDRPYPFRLILTRADGGATFSTDATYFMPSM
ncbi:MAG: 4Fe-4S binding protein [Nitrospirae bacterium]|nr:4Fe-4S binding protein [Nitrospirota bacterium]